MDNGSVKWSSRQEDILLFSNCQNKGFPAGCNQGIKHGRADSDILLLNSDTIIFPNSIFWLHMGLYENESVGATGCVTNHTPNGQKIDEEFNSLAEYERYAVSYNNASMNPYELKFYLGGFAVLIRREALDKIGLLDTRFSPGQCADTDLGTVYVRQAGKTYCVIIVLCIIMVVLGERTENFGRIETNLTEIYFAKSGILTILYLRMY